MIPVGEDGLELLDLHGLEVWDLKAVLGGASGHREEREERDEREHEPPAHDA